MNKLSVYITILCALVINSNLYAQNYFERSSNNIISCEGAIPGEQGYIDWGGFDEGPYTAVDNELLVEKIEAGDNLLFVCTTLVTSMNGIFSERTDFNKPIFNWDVSNVVDMSSMFKGAISFNQNLRYWDVSAVTNMTSMFEGATSFNQDIVRWNVSAVTEMDSMFNDATVFNQVLAWWCVSNILNEPDLFSDGSSLSVENLPKWGTCPEPIFALAPNGVTVTCLAVESGQTGELDGVIYEAVDLTLLRTRFNEDADLSRVCTTNIFVMPGVFKGKSDFNGDISSWDVSNVTYMVSMFEDATSFNSDISKWDMSSVTNMNSMFLFAQAFNQDIGDWDVSNATNMNFLFSGTQAFNQDIGDWDVSNVTEMSRTFGNASAFNKDISSWDVSSVTDMSYMFAFAFYFNQDISSWDVSNVSNMDYMFSSASRFNQSLVPWCVENITSEPTEFAYNSLLSESNKPNWGTCVATSNEVDYSNLPSKFNLSQNYPNPFNPSTQIQFDLPESGRVVLKVYNMLGQEVAVLVDEFRSAGSHSVNFDAGELTSGTYIYQLSTPAGVISKQMLLIK